MQNTTSQLCKAAPAGASGLVDAECDGASRAQRWRVAAAPAEAGGEQESAAQVLAQDSRLEAAVHAGQCAYLGTSGELQFGECVVRGKAAKTRGAQVRGRCHCTRSLWTARPHTPCIADVLACDGVRWRAGSRRARLCSQLLRQSDPTAAAPHARAAHVAGRLRRRARRPHDLPSLRRRCAAGRPCSHHRRRHDAGHLPDD